MPQERARTLAPLLRARLLESYDRGKRNLPWRHETDPYRIWVSEIMLQQTRVETVIPYYEDWVARFPDLRALAEAREEEVLKAWQGLGYYSRARRLWGGARVVMERWNGRVPPSAEELKTLPGIGEYTAGAIASIAFGQAVPAVDGNVRRVFSRLFDLPDPSQGELRSLASILVDPARPGDFNQALMEHGALVCTPRSPGCRGCPLSSVCLSRASGTVDERPLRKTPKGVPRVDIAVLVAAQGERWDNPDGGGSLLLRKRAPTGLLAGMWEFPGWEVQLSEEDPAEGTTPPPVVEGVRRGGKEMGLGEVSFPIPLSPVTHAFSHLRATYWPVLFKGPGTGAKEGSWTPLQEIEALALPVAQEKILALALKALGVAIPPPPAPGRSGQNPGPGAAPRSCSPPG